MNDERTKFAIDNLRAKLAYAPAEVCTAVTEYTRDGNCFMLVLLPVQRAECSRSGLSIDNITGHACAITGRQFNRKRGQLYFKGSGGTAGFEVVRELSRALFGDPDAINWRSLD